MTAVDLTEVRRRVAEAARRAGLEQDRVARFTLAVNEIVTNAIQHGGGAVTVTIARANDRVVVEVRDSGGGIPASVGADLPGHEQPRGRGLWLARHLSDDLIIGSLDPGTVVRLSAVAEHV